ncbi:hypothetical protein D3C74_430820 [compost metagenome]
MVSTYPAIETNPPDVTGNTPMLASPGAWSWTPSAENSERTPQPETWTTPPV